MRRELGTVQFCLVCNKATDLPVAICPRPGAAGPGFIMMMKPTCFDHDQQGARIEYVVAIEIYYFSMLNDGTVE